MNASQELVVGAKLLRGKELEISLESLIAGGFAVLNRLLAGQRGGPEPF